MVLLRDASLQDAAFLCQAQVTTASTAGHLVSLPDELIPLDFAQRIQLLSDGRGKYLVAEKEGERVGHACLSPLPRRNVSHVVQLDLCVHPGHTGKGYGRLLLKALIDWATHHPHTRKIELNVRSVNTRALALYRSLGFQEEGRLLQRVRLEQGVYCDDICMARHVKPDAQHTVDSGKP
jgi:RimJ/RimL family protein N-acetyltransferase